MEIKKDVVNLEQLKKNPVFQLSLSAKELFHSNFLYWIASSYPKLFNRVMKKLEQMQMDIQSAMQGMAPNGA